MTRDIDSIVQAYLAALDFADGPEDRDARGFHLTLIKQATEDVRSFLERIQASGVDSSEWSDEELGYDFWMTRQRHGVGFWDRGRESGEALTELAHTYDTLGVRIDHNGSLRTES